MKRNRRRPLPRAPRRPARLHARRRPHRLAKLLRSALRLATWHRILLGAVVLAVLLLPGPSPASDGSQSPVGCHGCHGPAAAAERWAVPLAGTWIASAANGTVPAFGQAYVAIGGGMAVVGDGLTLTGYASADHGKQRWQVLLSGPPGAVIMSVRAWAGVVTVGLLGPSGRSRTEVVIDSRTGKEVRHYPAAVFGGAVAASATTTVIVGPSSVTGYDNATGRARWRRATAASLSWQTDGKSLYVAEYRGGNPGASPVTALKVINLTTGAQRVLGSPVGHPFTGTLAIAAGGVVLFGSASGVTAYSVDAYGGSTGGALWSRTGTVPEGTDPAAHLVYLASADGALTGVDPGTGAVWKAVPASTVTGPAGGMYAVRAGIALGLAGGANGQAWGYRIAAGQVAWTSAQLPWPHFFSDVSGLGGSAEAAGNLVAVTACLHLAVSSGLCTAPELVAFTLLLTYRQGKSGL